MPLRPAGISLISRMMRRTWRSLNSSRIAMVNTSLMAGYHAPSLPLCQHTISDTMLRMKRGPYELRLKANAARMLAHPTPPEAIFRDRLIATKIRFESQVVIGRYIIDFVVPEKMIIYELDGKQHRQRYKIAYDQIRTEFLKTLGFKVRRIQNREAGTYRVNRLRFKQQAKKHAYEKALHRSRILLREYYKTRDERLELSRIYREQKQMVARNDTRQPRVIPYEYTPGWDGE